jgi:hypothetical protein
MSESGGFRSFQNEFGAKKLVKCANNPKGTKLRLFVFLFEKGAFSGKTMHKKMPLRRQTWTALGGRFCRLNRIFTPRFPALLL